MTWLGRGKSLAERLWSRTDKSGDCWIFGGSKKAHFGYGKIMAHGRRNRKAHRIAWEVTNGPIPAGMQVLHKCDNPPCVNPDHLFLGTQKDNVQDCIGKGRSTRHNRGRAND